MTIPEGEFGTRVRDRLGSERLIWFTTTSANGTPQPNPVWFIWDGDDSVLIYNAHNAVRLQHVAVRPRVSLNFDSAGNGDNIVVIAGVAEQALDEPPCDQNDAYLAKYGEAMKGISGTTAKFAEEYSVPLRIRFTKVRGF